MWYDEYLDRIDTALADEDKKLALRRATSTFLLKKRDALGSLPYLDYYRKRLREVKAWSIDHIDELIKTFKENFEALGGIVHIVSTKEELANVLRKVIGSGKLVIKSKSMTSEELEVNKQLEEMGNTVVETDLGERIVQLMGCRPSHVVVPAIHLTKEKVADLFSKVTGERVPPDPKAIVGVARRMLRDLYMKADVGISGANAIAAETGSILVLENEGNARFVTNAPPVHVVIAGIEKLVPTLEDAMLIAQVLPPYATGQRMATYLSIISGPSSTADIELTSVRGAHGPMEVHVVLVDNGRRRMLRDSRFKQALYCIRCGSCLNNCPIYQLLGDEFGYRYFGGIGTIWTAFTEGLKVAAPLAYACTLCGRCKLECPLELDIPEMVKSLRDLLIKEGYIPPPLSFAERSIIEKGNPMGI